ncbi:hypothetical protein [Paenibacillus wynnii]|uniref:Uncharacterized protein n=1 Tax=Paenibacillus wynnii TaxID=268407 RepID=A0A098MAA2_9BACL|nr:hypothetical protein [Paenibacillus wynnii]KGE18467.1 hypothetical protein PWYN_03090 [Paenibacillus wynnii]KGE20598.1 hypothetical protein PWYN_15530 [Paenibacillus wynnii]
MSCFFYGDSPHAVRATKQQMLLHAEEIKKTIAAKKQDIELVAINQLYKNSCVCLVNGSLQRYLIDTQDGYIRRDGEFRGYGGDAWEQAPNLVKLTDLEIGQMELF